MHAPRVRDFDPEDVDFDDGTRAAVSGVGKALLGLRGRSRHIAEDPAYAGRKVSRSELAEEEASGGDDEAAAALREIMETGDYGEGGEEASESGESAGASSADEDVVDAELRQLEAEDAEHLRRLTTHTQSERERGAHTRNQQALWEDMVELRIRLQAPLRAADRLPRPELHATFREESLEARAAIDGAAEAAAQLLDDLLAMRDDLYSRHEALRGGGARKAPARGLTAAQGADDAALAPRWARLAEQDARLGSYRDAVLDRWGERVQSASGGGARLKAFNQPPSVQIGAVLAQRERNLRRAHTVRSGTRAIGGEEPTAPAAAAGDREGDAPAAEVVDEERFDDGDFYEQMLHEFLASKQGGGAGGGAGVPRKRKSVKKSVDRRASKGRRLRFVPHPKLQNFVASEELDEPEVDVDELFKSLFKSS